MPIRCPPWKAQPTSKIFTPLQTHGMEKITAWRGRKLSHATQKKTRQSLTNKYVPIKFYKISKSNWFRNRAIGKRWGVRENASMPTG